MCSHYQAIKNAERLRKYFASHPPTAELPGDTFPKFQGLFVRRPIEWDAGDDAVPEREAALGRWGLIPSIVKPAGLARAKELRTFNARSETVARSYTFENAWRRGQRCIVPAEAIYEPDWRTGKHVPTRFTRTDGAPLGLAGLWDRYRSPSGEMVETFTMLTINADAHPLFKHYHRPGKEKRMVVILPEVAYGDWLAAGFDESHNFLVGYPAEKLTAEPVPKS